ncbi:hypothetical protein FISHEDRAFT_7655, partial [Fistulina hepatica ATCC 64428]
IRHGPMFIGTVLNVLLYGISITQTYLYWTHCRKKFANFHQHQVLFLFLADTVQTVFTIIYMYLSLIVHFGDVSYLGTANWIFNTDPAMGGIIGGVAQLFYAWRVYTLTRFLPMTVAICLLSGANLLMGIATAIACGIVPQFNQFQTFRVVVIIWLASSAMADALITFSMVFYLRQHKTGFARTDTNIDRIIRRKLARFLTLSKGMITAIWALTDLLVYLFDSTGLHLLFNFPLSKLYSNSLLSSLNSRGGWKWGENDTSE